MPASVAANECTLARELGCYRGCKYVNERNVIEAAQNGDFNVISRTLRKAVVNLRQRHIYVCASSDVCSSDAAQR
jgi:hypothetical protein